MILGFAIIIIMFLLLTKESCNISKELVKEDRRKKNAKHINPQGVKNYNDL